jgi:hypothetical protein
VFASEGLRLRFERWLNACPDDVVLRWLFGAVLIATASVLALDYYEMYTAPDMETALISPASPSSPASNQPADQPLPPARHGGDDKRRAPLRVSDKQLAAAMTFELVGDGKLMAIGTIMPGSADALAAEIAKRGSYVKTIVLHSPGGSVQDALKMGRLIREKKFSTEVESGRYCASSCPLVFAGGVERRAGDKAAIGVHQVFAASAPAGAKLGDGMDSAQRVSAECQRYLRDMGIDLAVWVHAMETPKDELFYFRPDELLALKLATQSGAKSPVARANS